MKTRAAVAFEGIFPSILGHEGAGFVYGAVPPKFLARIVAGIPAIWRYRSGRLVPRS